MKHFFVIGVFSASKTLIRQLKLTESIYTVLAVFIAMELLGETNDT
jgi:hypothetical protein